MMHLLSTDSLTANTGLENAAELVVSLYREGRLDDLREVLTDARLKAETADGFVWASNNLAVVEHDLKRPTRALEVYLESIPFVSSCDDWNRAQFNHGLAYTLKNIADREGVTSYYDRALIRYQEAGYYFERSGRIERVWSVKNNIANIQIALKRPADAHLNLDEATQILNQHGGADKSARLAEVCDTRALAYEVEGKAEDAFYASHKAMELIREANEPLLQARLLETHLRVTETLRGGVVRLKASAAGFPATECRPLETPVETSNAMSSNTDSNSTSTEHFLDEALSSVRLACTKAASGEATPKTLSEIHRLCALSEFNLSRALRDVETQTAARELATALLTSKALNPTTS